MLKNMDFAHMHVECIEDIETGSLLEAKQNRSRLNIVGLVVLW